MIKKAIWKYPYNLYLFNTNKENEKIFNRNITLTSKYLNKSLKCYKGKVSGKLIINNQHLGFKLGSFFVTKILGERIAYRKKQKLLLKKSKQKQLKKKK